MFRAPILAGGIAVAVALAAPARAGGSQYLERLDRTHVSYTSTADALSWGASACDQLRAGTPVPAVISALQNGGGYTDRDAGEIIGAATIELCPDQHQTAVDWAHRQLG